MIVSRVFIDCFCRVVASAGEKLCAIGKCPAGLVLQAPFTSLQDEVKLHYLSYVSTISSLAVVVYSYSCILIYART